MEAERVVGRMLNQKGKRRDAAISTAERKWGCRDKDKLRQREREKIRGRLQLLKESWMEERVRANRKMKEGKKAMKKRKDRQREAKEVSSGCQPGGSASGCNHGSSTGCYGNQQDPKKQSGQQGQIDSVLPLLRKETQVGMISSNIHYSICNLLVFCCEHLDLILHMLRQCVSGVSVEATQPAAHVHTYGMIAVTF